MGQNIGYLKSKSDKVSDEYYTPREAVIPLLEYLDAYYNKPNYTIWCPFDKEESEYVKIFKEEGYNVIYSHIDDGQNFFFYEPKEHYDFIISNPPFSLKDQILKRLYELNKPYAMLLPLPTLQGQKRFPYLKDCEALIFDKRISFWLDLEHTKRSNAVPFASIYICRNFLPERLIFKEI